MHKIRLTLLFVICIFFSISKSKATQTVSVTMSDEFLELQNSEIIEYLEKSKNFTHTLAILTGTAVNPLFVTSAVGIYEYYSTPQEKRDQLPWFYSSWFLILCISLVVIAFLISIPSSVTNLPPTISAFVELCNKKIGLLMTTPIILDMVTTNAKLLAENVHSKLTADSVYFHASFIPTEFLSAIPSTIWLILIVPMLLFTFFTIWFLNYVFDILIFLCPFGWVDLCLKIARGIFFAILLAVAIFFPQLTFGLFLIVAIISILLLGWSVRWVVMGIIFLKDFLFRNENVFNEKSIIAFSNSSIGIPSRCFGRLTNNEGQIRFLYRKFFLFPKAVTIKSTELLLKKGFLFSKITNDRNAIGILPPRYQNVSEQIQNLLNIQRIEDKSQIKNGINNFVMFVKDCLWSKQSQPSSKNQGFSP